MSAILVTGGFGLVGSTLVRHLVREGRDVVVLQRDVRARSAELLAGLEGRVTIAHGDITDPLLADRLMTGYDVTRVFHLASQPIVETAGRSPVPTFETNVRGSWLLLDACARHGVEAVVVASSPKAYGSGHPQPISEDAAARPDEPYGASKAATDLLARAYAGTDALPVVSLRCANVYGGGDLNPSRLVPAAVSAALQGRAPVIRSDGTPERDFLHVDDAVDAFLLAADGVMVGGRIEPGAVLNAGSGRPISVRTMVESICHACDSDMEPVIEGAPAETLDRVWLDAGRLSERTGWRPRVALAEGVARTVSWYREHPEALVG